MSATWRGFVAACSVALLLGACSKPAEPEAPQAPETPVAKHEGAPRKDLTVMMVGDINLGRQLGRQLVAGRKDFPFQYVRSELSGADITFGNLESQISDQQGQTEGSSNYVFTGPPQGADELANAGFDVVSTANNHAWDYGERAMRETLSNLKRVGIAAAGTGENIEEAYQAAIIERNGWRVAVLGVTGIFNSPFETSPARNHVAWADPVLVSLRIKELKRDGADVVIVSYHGGVEYSPTPTDETRAFVRGCIDAGADVVVGHHPHVTQGVEFYKGKPIFYSLGNFVFKQFDPWTDRGLAVRMTFRDTGAPTVAYLPVAVDFQPRFLSASDGAALIARVRELSGGSLPESAD